MPDPAGGLSLPVENVRLSNGLRVELHRDDSVPIVAVHLCYHVGAKDDPPGRTGLAHLVEHLMFEGSANWDDDYFRPLQEAGASVNGSTGQDYTSYYDVVPSNFLDLALWLESDRMANLLPALSSAKLENQRRVVKNERRQRVDNQPYGPVSEEMFALLYPPDHPYHWPVIGCMEHLDAISMVDVAAFHKRAYSPSNAVLTLSGSFAPDAALASITRQFGSLAASEPIAKMVPRPSQVSGEIRRDLRAAVGLPRIDLVWPTIPRFHKDEPALDFAAQILGGGRESRLRRVLQRDRNLAHSADAYHSTLALGGHFGIRVYGLAGRSLRDIEPVALDAVADLERNPPTIDEMRRALNSFLNRAFSRLETTLSKAAMIQHFAFHHGEMRESLFTEEIVAYQSVQSEDVADVVRRYLGDNGLAITVQSGAAAAKDVHGLDPIPTAKDRSGGDIARLPAAGPTPSFSMPRTHAARIGRLDLVVVQTPGKPRVLAEIVSDAGSVEEPVDHLGRAKLMAYCLDEGTETLAGPELASRIELLGAGIGVSPGIECSTVSLRSLRSNFRDSFQLFADVVARPAFRQEDVARESERLIAELAHKANQPRSIADDAIEELIFGPHHPYGRTSDGTTESLSSERAADLKDFHRRFVTADRSTLVVVGDVSLAEASDVAAECFGGWLTAVSPTKGAAIAPPCRVRNAFRLMERAEATQSVVRVGRVAVERDSPDYEALVLLNTVLGGQFSSRLNSKLREEMGATYGVQSAFTLRRHGGSFLAGADVELKLTREAIEALLNEILAPTAARPITAKELEFAKSYFTRRFPGRFETPSGVLSHVIHTAVYRLPIDYYDGYLARIASVSLDHVNDCARRYLSPEGMKVVVVGGRDAADGIEELVYRCLCGPGVDSRD